MTFCYGNIYVNFSYRHLP